MATAQTSNQQVGTESVASFHSAPRAKRTMPQSLRRWFEMPGQGQQGQAHQEPTISNNVNTTSVAPGGTHL